LWQDLYQQFKAMEGAEASSGSVNQEL